jgi:hypothetical protein
MAKKVRAKTKMSAKGQGSLPDGVLLTAGRSFAPTRFEDVFGCLGPVDRPISDEDMSEAVLAEARRRYARD